MGACSTCGGYGDIVGIDPELVVPNTGLSIYENAIAPWRGEKLKKYKNELIKNASNFKFPIHKPYYKLSNDQKKLVWEGNEYFKGINYFFNNNCNIFWISNTSDGDMELLFHHMRCHPLL